MASATGSTTSTVTWTHSAHVQNQMGEQEGSCSVLKSRIVRCLCSCLGSASMLWPFVILSYVYSPCLGTPLPLSTATQYLFYWLRFPLLVVKDLFWGTDWIFAQYACLLPRHGAAGDTTVCNACHLECLRELPSRLSCLYTIHHHLVHFHGLRLQQAHLCRPRYIYQYQNG